MLSELRRTGEMLLPAIAYGDAAGVPVETKSYNYIADRYGSIDRLIPTTDNLYFKGDWPEGKTSDDTAMSIDIFKALLESNSFDLPAIARNHIETFGNTPEVTITKNGIKKVKKLGYGSSTSNSLERIMAGTSPYESGEVGGNGNGVIMKMSALVLWQYAQRLPDAKRHEQYDQLTTMTHDSDVARITTRVHGDVLHDLLTNDYDEQRFGRFANSRAIYHEREFGLANRDTSRGLEFLKDHRHLRIVDVEKKYAHKAVGVTDKEFGRSYGFYVPETLAISYAAFELGGGDYANTVYTAVNLGGDADSTASIAGAMVNFRNKGEITFPEDVAKVQDIQDLRKLSHKFGAYLVDIY